MLFDDSRRFFERAKEANVDITMQTWDNTLHVFQHIKATYAGHHDVEEDQIKWLSL